MPSVINLQEINKNKVASTMVNKQYPTNPIFLDSQNETMLSSIGKGTAAVVVGYNKGKPNLNTPSIILFTRGVGTEDDNLEMDPSILLNPESAQHITVPSHVISSCSDVLLKSYGSNYIAENRSVVMSNADVIQHRGNEVIELVAGISAYRTAGPRINTFGGVHLIKSGKETNLQPMVLGNNLVKTLLEMTDFVNSLSTRILELRKDLMFLKAALLAHVHVATGPGAPTLPSPDMLVTVAPTLLTDSLEISNSIGNTINLELFKINHLFPFSGERITSEDHKLT
jgi:hypothetical protein